MSTNLQYRARERQRKRERGSRPAKLNEKKGDRELEQEIKKKGVIFFGRTTGKFFSGGDKMRNASGRQLNAR